MRVLKITWIVGTLALLVGMAALNVSAKSKLAPAAATTEPEKPKDFRVFDNMAYKDQPDLTQQGLTHCNIIYDVHPKPGHMPDEQTVKDEVTKKLKDTPGPLVFDIEDSNDWSAFVTLVKWTHEAVPGSVVGFYGHGTETDELAKAVDAFFPSDYTFSDNRAGWKSKLEHDIKQAHSKGSGKPVYPYLWPQYHHGTKKSWKFLDGDYWLFQLQTARESGADGVVLWGNSVLKGKPQPPWKDDAPWWQSTVKFLGELNK
jgi:hypothetical protein